MGRPGKKKGYDYTLLAVVFLLVFVGLMILYSTSAYNGELKFHDRFYYLKKQLFATILGTVLMLIVANIDYHVWEPLAGIGYLVAIGLSVAVIFIGDEYNGSKRWLSLGPLSFQPSEYAKVALILFLACIVTKNVKEMGKIKTLFKIMLMVLPVVGLVGASNLSTAIIILGIAVILIFVASPKYAQFIWMGLLGCGFLGIFLGVESYRLERLAIWRNPEKYEKGYQTLQGLYATGDFKYCGSDKYDSQYRNHTSVYQLWRDIGSVSFDGNGTCAECVQSDTIKRTSGAEGRDGNKVVRRIG